MRKQPPQGTEEYRVYKRALEFKYANTEHGFLKRLFQSIYTRAKYNTNRNKPVSYTHLTLPTILRV